MGALINKILHKAVSNQIDWYDQFRNVLLNSNHRVTCDFELINYIFDEIVRSKQPPINWCFELYQKTQTLNLNVYINQLHLNWQRFQLEISNVALLEKLKTIDWNFGNFGLFQLYLLHLFVSLNQIERNYSNGQAKGKNLLYPFLTSL